MTGSLLDKITAATTGILNSFGGSAATVEKVLADLPAVVEINMALERKSEAHCKQLIA